RGGSTAIRLFRGRPDPDPERLHRPRSGRIGKHDRRRHWRLGPRAAHEPRDRTRGRAICEHRRDRLVDARASGEAGRHVRCQEGAVGMTSVSARGALTALCLLAIYTFPLWTPNLYLLHIATLVAAYWVLIAGLNLVVGYAGALSIGHVGLLSIGAYAFAILVGKYGFDPLATLIVSGTLGAGCGFILGLPSLRLPGFYFAMSTIALAMIVAEWSLALDGLTGGGTGLPVPGFNSPFNTPAGFYWLVAAIAGAVTWMTWNVAR